jgi:hypothetical protein
MWLRRLALTGVFPAGPSVQVCLLYATGQAPFG